MLMTGNFCGTFLHIRKYACVKDLTNIMSDNVDDGNDYDLEKRQMYILFYFLALITEIR